MSLLSDTQGHPERVWSLLRLLDALGGSTPKEDIATWMMPASFRQSDDSVKNVQQLIGAARSLGLVVDKDGELALTIDRVPEDMIAFSILAHQKLREEPAEADAIMLQVYACIVLETERTGGTNWLNEHKSSEIADRINAILEKGVQTETRLFNKTKLTAWRRWMIALGLGVEAGRILGTFYPHPAEGLSRELIVIREEHGSDKEIPAGVFIKALARQMPYLDGGSVYKDISDRLGYQPQSGRVSRVLSEALLDLHAEGCLRLVPRADASDALTLVSHATSAIRSFAGVVISGGAI